MTKNKTAICTPTETRAEFESILRELDGVGVTWECGESLLDTWCLDYYFSGCVISYRWGGEKNLMCGFFKPSREKQLPRAEFIAAIKRDFAPKIDCSYPTEIIKPCKHTFEMRYKGTEVYWACSKCGSHKEKPKMNYNKMTKVELISKLKFENACNDELRSNYGILKDENELHRVELGRLQGQNRKCFEQITALEKANTEFKAKWNEQDEANNKAFGECANLKDINRELLGDTKQLEKTNAEQAETIMDLNSRLKNSGNISDGWRKTAGDASGLVKELRAENIRIKRLAAQILCADVLEGK